MVYVDAAENSETLNGKPKQPNRERRALGEIKNTMVIRRKYSELNNGLKNIKLKEPVKPRPRRTLAPKKVVKEVKEEPSAEDNQSPQIVRKRRLSSMLRVSEYANDIYKYLHRVEDKYPIKYPAKAEKKFGEHTRFALVNWLVEINEQCNFIHETLQLCVSIIDRYLQEDDTVNKNQLPLLALAASFIASKYEEIVPLEINDLLVYDSVLSSKEILNMETKIVTTMQYSFGRPVPAHFVRRYCCVAQATSIEQTLAFYLSDVALMSYKICYLKPSIIAAGALFIAFCISKQTVDESLWNSTLINYSTYEVYNFQDCVVALAKCLKRLSTTRFQALHIKYSKAKHFNVSNLPGLPAIINQLAQ